MAQLEVGAVPLRQLDGDLRGAVSRREEFRQILLLPGDLSVRRADLAADSCSYSGRRDRRDPLLHHTEVVEAAETDCLVRRRDAMFLLALRLLRWHYHVLVAQRF